ncbi:LytR/AlgR family response regulator transcription factor [Aestuariibaculum lutulentum]|uniref:LytTR family DNA-binding domain-containing protein n=1 Tax=Aestuariibaculum lutulentum TaxID=2920935 RepID=A0ABS9RGW7_9FLAO|nr:LytTR family DNA-binding domain-containing protein [Aestuariibaculum lutulentum]MCH4552185.1 LytTR family DNA-binding domain-containing protein [Aestuariibaculum lutulentum]
MSAKYTTIIIDDEQSARDRLERLLGVYPETFQIIGIAKNGTEAKELINTLNPDLIFLDVEMPGLNGFEVLQSIEVIPIVIFCTAYDQYSLQAFETNSLDYLVKPVRKERLETTIKKLKLFDRSSNENILNTIRKLSVLKTDSKMTSITIKKGDKIVFIKLEEVLYFEAEEKYVTVYTPNEKHLSEQSLLSLEQKLPKEFLRVHRSIIVNTNHVKEVQKYFSNRFIISLNNNSKTSITTGRTYNEIIKKWMGI